VSELEKCAYCRSRCDIVETGGLYNYYSCATAKCPNSINSCSSSEQWNLLNQAIEEHWRSLVTCEKCGKEMFIACVICESRQFLRIASAIKVPSE
jgi:hypothetical protein